MDTTNALINYGNRVRSVKEHTEANKAIFDQHTQLVGLLIDAENALRDAAAEAGEGISNGEFRVVVTPQTQTWADIEVIDSLIANGYIQSKYRDQIIKTIARPARISISEIKEPRV